MLIDAWGLCFTYFDRWGHDHVCPKTVQLHALEELMEFMGVEDIVDLEHIFELLCMKNVLLI